MRDLDFLALSWQCYVAFHFPDIKAKFRYQWHSALFSLAFIDKENVKQKLIFCNAKLKS